MKRTLLCAGLLLLFVVPARAVRRYDGQGLVVKVDKSHNSLVISCDRIAGFMDAMVMPFPVRDPKQLDGLNVGTMIQFTLIVDKSSSYIESIHIRQYQSVEQDPLSARRLKLMASLMDGRGASPELKVGEHLPDFSLIDQSNQKVTLSQFSGKVVAITFTYTHCALPNFCFRIANSFRTLQKRFASQMGSDLILLTITFDPAHDTPKVMAQYGKTWNADPKSWHLLTGPPDQVQQLCARFGISFWPDEGLMTHSLHTLVVDRNGNLVADLEGNEFTADQLGDLVQSVLVRDPHRSAESVGR
jgi:protein SCO1/2